MNVSICICIYACYLYSISWRLMIVELLCGQDHGLGLQVHEVCLRSVRH